MYHLLSKCYPLVLFVGFFLLLSACEDPIYIPKPRAYPKVVYPERSYQSFTEDYCSFTFEYPKYTIIEQDTLFFGKKPDNACWFDLYTKSLNAKIYCSYVPIDKNNSFEKLRDDAFLMADEHIVKANYINRIPIQNKNGVSGFAFNLEGPVASPFMFYLTDSTDHFLRASLYFNSRAEPDSLAPVVKFVKDDILHMIQTFEWND